jgi:hypothetical protein
LQALEPHTHHALIIDGTPAFLRKEGDGGGTDWALFKNLDGFAPGFLLRVVDLAQVKDVTLDDFVAADPLVLHPTPVAMFFPALLPFGATQKHIEQGLSIKWAGWEEGGSSLRPLWEPFGKSRRCAPSNYALKKVAMTLESAKSG